MAVKTITITEDAYEALKAQKAANESFSDTIRRIAGRRSLKEFAGALSKESADILEKSIAESRMRRAKAKRARIERVTRELEGANGSP